MTFLFVSKSQLENDRCMRVNRLTKQFIARGVSPVTSLEWAEAEVPPIYVFENCIFDPPMAGTED